MPSIVLRINDVLVSDEATSAAREYLKESLDLAKTTRINAAGDAAPLQANKVSRPATVSSRKGR